MHDLSVASTLQLEVSDSERTFAWMTPRKTVKIAKRELFPSDANFSPVFGKGARRTRKIRKSENPKNPEISGNFSRAGGAPGAPPGGRPRAPSGGPKMGSQKGPPKWPKKGQYIGKAFI